MALRGNAHGLLVQLSSEECSNCPPGSFSNSLAAVDCEECDFFFKSNGEGTGLVAPCLGRRSAAG